MAIQYRMTLHQPSASFNVGSDQIWFYLAGLQYISFAIETDL